MSEFWHLARRMLRYRGMMGWALAMALVSAGGLGAGLVAIVPVLENIVPKADGKPAGRDLSQIVSDAAGRVGVNVPQAWLDALPTGPFTAVVVIIGVLGVMTVIGGLASFMHQFLALTVVQRAVTNVRREMFHRVVRLPLKDVVAGVEGGATDIVSRIAGDTVTLGAGFNALLSKAVTQVSKGIAALIAALVIDWRLTLAALLLAPVLYTVIRRLGKRIKRASRAALESQAGLFGASTEALQGLRVVKVHTTERYEAGRFHRMNKEVMRQMMKMRTVRAVASPLMEVLSIMVLGGLSLVAAKLIIDQHLTAPDFILTMAALGTAGAALKPLTGIVNDVQSSAGAAERIVGLMRRMPEPGHDHALPRLPRHRESIELRNVWLTYPGAAEPSLRGVSLKVRFGERVAIVGPNGSGKTTLLAMVPRLFDPDVTEPRGELLFDGQDVSRFGVRSLRRQIGVVTQETVLFRGTIRSNIAYGAERLTQEKIESAARQARAHGFITQLPKGYDTPVGEQGLTLSGGQRQRIAIARAILRDPAVLILDEATSMIDADSEAQISAAMTEFTTGRTCLIVAHRLSTVVNADRIVVMDQGRIVDEGSHAELLARCRVYQLIARTQLLKGEDAAAEAPAR